ncbi:MAG: hypothetical protein NXI04_13205 [Planctomycetaceae bacterium]|nr:hypothetical protein [Planctomycetaceae bacterium]
MIGTRITGTHNRSIVTYTLPFASCILLAIAWLAGEWPPVVLAAGPIIIFVCILRQQSHQFECEVREQGLWFPATDEQVPYSSITAIEYVPTEKKPRSPIILSRSSRSVLIPASLNVDGGDLYNFLTSQLSLKTQSHVPPALQQYYEQQVAEHGESAVLVLNARQKAGKRPKRETASAVVRGLLISGVVFGVGTLLNAMMLVAAVITLLLAGLVWGYSAERSKRLTIEKGILNSAIVVTPEGMAMQQGPVSGAIEWSRVQGVSLVHLPRSVESSSVMHGTVAIKVGTSQISVRDAYELPIFSLCRVLTTAWENRIHSPAAVVLKEQHDNSPFRPPTQT